jgi:hypothetical protein
MPGITWDLVNSVVRPQNVIHPGYSPAGPAGPFDFRPHSENTLQPHLLIDRKPELLFRMILGFLARPRWYIDETQEGCLEEQTFPQQKNLLAQRVTLTQRWHMCPEGNPPWMDLLCDPA